MANDPTPTHFIAPALEEIAPHFPAYEMEYFIAQGGMGAVYQARQKSLDRSVAIKILPREFGQDEAFRTSFEAEAKAMAKLNHPNLISVYDFGEVDGMLFLIMEFVNGKSLYHSSHGRAIDPVQAGNIVSAICLGLDHAHTAGILHRDVKPANILLTPDAIPKIGDFGLARPIDTTANPDEIVYGTPGYTAPEVISGGQVDHRSDIFSTGVMLYELLTGSLPDANRTSPSLVAGTPQSFDNIIARAIHPSPDLRFTSAKEMAEAIEDATKSTSPATPKLAVVTSSRPISTSAVNVPTKSPSSVPLVATLVAVAAVIAIVVAILPKDEEEPPAPPQTASEPEQPATEPVAPPPTPPEPEPVIAIEPVPEPEKDTIDPDETILQALARLKNQLAAGDRDEFPPQAIAYGDNHYLILEKGMSWDQAQLFAVEHGAHLAILPDKQERETVTRMLGVTTPAWLGAGKAAKDQIQWMDGSPWNTKDVPAESKEDGRAIATRQHGELILSKQSVSHRPILQWRKDASNPCTLEAQLERTKKSIDSSGIQNATFPVGTRTIGNSHYLLITKPLSWEDANQLAESCKAHLASPTSSTEQQLLAQAYSQMNITAWLGGYLPDEKSSWQWVTKESFSANLWSSGEPQSTSTRNRILMKVNRKTGITSWHSSNGSIGDASHILLEWDFLPSKAASKTKFDLEKWLKGVNRKIAVRVEPLLEKYEEEREKEIDKYVREMKRAAKKVEFPGGRRGPRGDRFKEYFENLVDEAMDEVKESGEIIDNIPERAPREFHTLNREARKSLQELKENHLKEMNEQLEFYTNGLLRKATDLAKNGFNEQASKLKENVAEIGEDTKKFTSALGL